MSTLDSDISKIIEDFGVFCDWEEKYSYLIECGKNLEQLEAQYKIDSNKIVGCMSQVWLITYISCTEPPKLYFKADSDSYIVKGIIYILLKIYSGKTAEKILSINIDYIFNELKLNEYLSANRTNGIFSIVKKIVAISTAINQNNK